MLNRFTEQNISKRIKTSYLKNMNLMICVDVQKNEIKKIILEWLDSKLKDYKKITIYNQTVVEIDFSEIVENFINGVSKLRIKAITSSGTIMRSLNYDRTSEGILILL
jgi:hypothetical protein